jgi:hypothetical protein
MFAIEIEQRKKEFSRNFGFKTTFTFTHIFVGDQSGIMMLIHNNNSSSNNNKEIVNAKRFESKRANTRRQSYKKLVLKRQNNS